MRRKKAMLALILVFLAILTGCAREEVIKDNAITETRNLNRPDYRKDTGLFIAMDTEFGHSFNPFLPMTRAEEIVLSEIFTSPLISNMDNELIPWNGNIISGGNADGSVSYIVTVDENQSFTDGTPVTIDDYLYTLYVKADPSYMGKDPLTELDIRGLKSYYYDDDAWYQNLTSLYEYAMGRYSMDTIGQDDYTQYLVSSRLEGRFDEKSIEEWKDILRSGGYGKEALEAETDEDVLELVALYEYGENMEDYDPLTWYGEKLLGKYIEDNLNGNDHVERISGIEKLNRYTCRITLDSVTPETARLLNTYIVPSHYYGEFRKGDISPVTEKDIPLGSGPYTFYAEYDDKVVLKANPLYREGIPNIENVVFLHMNEDSIISALQIGAIDIGLLKGREHYLEKLGHQDVKCDLIPQGLYPSIFLSTSTLSREDRHNLHSLIRNTVKFLPLSALEKKVEAPISPLIPEYPESFKPLIDEKQQKIEGKEKIRILIDSSIPESSMAMLVRDLHSNLRLVGNILETEYLPQNEIRREMLAGLADAAILPSSGNLEEKALMYHSRGEGNIQGIDDRVIDEIIENLMKESSLDERRKLTRLLSKRIETESLEVPLYQNRAIIAYNIHSLDISSLPEVSTSSWNVLSTLWSLRKN